MLWEVDCNRNILHHQSHCVRHQSRSSGGNDRGRAVRGGLAIRPAERWHVGGSRTRGTEDNRAERVLQQPRPGNGHNLLPQIATMIKRGILQKGDKKTVNGVRCREWLVTMKGGPSGLEHDTVCLGLDDHLPYEMTVDWEASRSTFSDYNAPLNLTCPKPRCSRQASSTN